MKKMIAKSFSKSSSNYDSYAVVQKKCRDDLLVLLDKYEHFIPPGSIWEIGCGTGALTEEIVTRYPTRSIMISDISSMMLSRCKQRLKTKELLSKRLSFLEEDVEETTKKERYSLIISNLTLQWFYYFADSFRKCIEALKKEGVFLFSVMEENSFPEWKAVCTKTSLPFTGNTFPKKEMIEKILKNSVQEFTLKEQIIQMTYASSLDFFKYLKQVGAHTSLHQKKIPISQLCRLIKEWDLSSSEITLSYVVLFGFAKK